MLHRLSLLKKDELVRGSFVLFVMFGVYNVLNYIFQISMARTLGPADYGIFAVLMSIVYVFSIPSEAIQTVIAKYTSSLNARGHEGKIKDLLMRSLRKGALLAFALFMAFLLIAFFVSDFLNISWGLVAVTGLFIFNIFTLPITRGVIQGKKQFFSLGSNLIEESFIKVIASLVLVLIGLGVYGAMFGVIVGWVIAFSISFIVLKPVLRSMRHRETFVGVYRTNAPVLLATMAIVLMYSLDIIFARRFFSPVEVGEFAFISLIGKAIFFASTAIAKAMFPISTEGFEKGHRTSRLFKQAIALVGIMAFCALVIYFLYPKEIIFILSLGSKNYLGGAPFLFIVGLAYSLLSISNIIVLYKASINKITRHVPILLCFPIIQIALFYFFRSSLQEFAIALALSCLGLFIYAITIALGELSRKETVLATRK